MAAPAVRAAMEAGSRRRLKQLGVTEAQAERAVELIAGRVPATSSRAGRAPRRARHPGRRPGDRPPARPRGDAGPRRPRRRTACSSRSTLPRRPTASARSTSSPAATTPPTPERPPTTSPTGPACQARHPPAGAVRDRGRPGPPRPPPGLRRTPARLARPHPHRPARTRQGRPPGRRHPPPGRPRERRRHRHLDPLRGESLISKGADPPDSAKGTVPFRWRLSPRGSRRGCGGGPVGAVTTSSSGPGGPSARGRAGRGR